MNNAHCGQPAAPTAGQSPNHGQPVAIGSDGESSGSFFKFSLHGKPVSKATWYDYHDRQQRRRQ